MKFKIIMLVSVMIAGILIRSSYTLSKKAEAQIGGFSGGSSGIGSGGLLGGATGGAGGGTSISVQPGLDLSYEYAGTMQITQVCCNGLVYTITNPKQGSVKSGQFIFPWTNMIPVPQIGIGLYQYWTLQSGKTVAGDAIKGGTCITIVSECESSTKVDYTTKKMGVIKNTASTGSTGSTGIPTSGF